MTYLLTYLLTYSAASVISPCRVDDQRTINRDANATSVPRPTKYSISKDQFTFLLSPYATFFNDIHDRVCHEFTAIII